MDTPAAQAPPAPPPGWDTWEDLMALALDQARIAAQLGEVPVGALLVSSEGEILAQAHNGPITNNDPTAHAEMRVLRLAGETLGNYRLENTTLVVTLEPCLMCLGALIHARVAAVVFGAYDEKAGAICSRLDGPGLDFLNHRLSYLGGISGDACGALLSNFFQDLREQRKARK